MFAKITSQANLEAAYLEIVEQFSADRRNFKYHGLDNIFLRDLDLKSSELIKIIRSDLLQKKEIEPALSVKIPKNNKPDEYREIFIYNLKERIKAQAIYRVVLPEFEKVFSKRLFSYRPDKPPYLAASIFCRRYRREFSHDQALILDLKNYSDKIDRELMFSQLQAIFDDREVLGLLRLFVFNRIYRDGVALLPDKGLVQGVPLIALFANLHLTDLDFKYQARVSFYIRVGDDIALLDRSAEKLGQVLAEIRNDIFARGLEINSKKLFLGAASGRYAFLGYAFSGGVIGLEPGFIKRIEGEWKDILTYQHLNPGAKQRLLKRIMSKPAANFNNRFAKIVKDKSQVNDIRQIEKMSEDFFTILTKFFYEHYSPRNRRLLEKELAPAGVSSLYKVYKNFHYDRS